LERERSGEEVPRTKEELRSEGERGLSKDNGSSPSERLEEEPRILFEAGDDEEEGEEVELVDEDEDEEDEVEEEAEEDEFREEVDERSRCCC
jgi:hypothetical protein